MAEKNSDVHGNDSNGNNGDSGNTSNLLKQGEDTKNEVLKKTADSKEVPTSTNNTSSNNATADLHDSTNGTNEKSIGEKRNLEPDSNDANVDSPSSKIARVE